MRCGRKIGAKTYKVRLLSAVTLRHNLLGAATEEYTYPTRGSTLYYGSISGTRFSINGNNGDNTLTLLPLKPLIRYMIVRYVPTG